MNNIDIKQIPNEIILLTFHISFKKDDYFCDLNKNGSIEMYDQLLQTIVNPQFATWYNEQTITTHKQFEEEINNLRAKFNNGEIDYKELGAQAKIARANKDESQAYVSHTSLFRSQFFLNLKVKLEII